MKYLFAILFLCCDLNAAFAGEKVEDIVGKIAHESNERLLDCAESGSFSCARDIGVFFAYNFIYSDGKKHIKDNQYAKKFAFKTVSDPLSKFILGKILLEESKGPIQGYIGHSLINMACSFGSIDACSYAYFSYTNNKYSTIFCENKACNAVVDVTRKMIELLDHDKNYNKADEFRINLAKMLIENKNPEVEKLLKDLVDKDTPWATMLLAPLYDKGEFVKKNKVKAYMLYDLTGTGFNEEKAKVAEEMTPAQIQQAKEMSWRWQDEHRSYRPGYRDSDMGVQWQGVRYH